MTKLSELLDDKDPILQALRLGQHQFPGIWQYMMPREFLGLKLPTESRASCMSCPKSSYDSYRPDYRCCTYHPRVANFLLGLATQTPQGAASVQSVLERGMLLPEGMHYAPGQWFDYLDDLESESFGKSTKVLCPHLEQKTGYCMIHAFRNSVCSTFFCYKDHGDLGDQFWAGVQTLGSQVEMSLSQWALSEVGFDLRRYFATFDRLAPEMSQLSKQTGWQDHVLEVLWGDWWGREVELFQACAAAVVRQRQNLWDIANSFPIGESQAFDRAMIRAVPRHLKDQVDPEDQNIEAGDAARPHDLWLNCLKSYHKLWNLPEGAFELNPRIEIIANNCDTEEDKFYSDKPFCLNFYLRKSSKAIDWRLFLSCEQKNLLYLFKDQALELDWHFIARREFSATPEAKEFLAGMVAQKVLIRRRYH